LTVEHIQPEIRHTGNGRVHLFQGAPIEKRLKDGGLEVLDELEFAPSLHLKPLELCQRTIFVEYSIPSAREIIETYIRKKIVLKASTMCMPISQGKWLCLLLGLDLPEHAGSGMVAP
jgi:hypothetical protein